MTNEAQMKMMMIMVIPRASKMETRKTRDWRQEKQETGDKKIKKWRQEKQATGDKKNYFVFLVSSCFSCLHPGCFDEVETKKTAGDKKNKKWRQEKQET